MGRTHSQGKPRTPIGSRRGAGAASSSSGLRIETTLTVVGSSLATSTVSPSKDRADTVMEGRACSPRAMGAKVSRHAGGRVPGTAVGPSISSHGPSGSRATVSSPQSHPSPPRAEAMTSSRSPTRSFAGEAATSRLGAAAAATPAQAATRVAATSRQTHSARTSLSSLEHGPNHRQIVRVGHQIDGVDPRGDLIDDLRGSAANHPRTSGLGVDDRQA